MPLHAHVVPKHAEMQALGRWPEGLPPTYDAMREQQGALVVHLLRRYNKVDSDIEDLCQYVWKRLQEADVLGKYALSMSEVIPETIGTAEVLRFLNISADEFFALYKSGQSGLVELPATMPFKQVADLLNVAISYLEFYYWCRIDGEIKKTGERVCKQGGYFLTPLNGEKVRSRRAVFATRDVLQFMDFLIEHREDQEQGFKKSWAGPKYTRDQVHIEGEPGASCPAIERLLSSLRQGITVPQPINGVSYDSPEAVWNFDEINLLSEGIDRLYSLGETIFANWGGTKVFPVAPYQRMHFNGYLTKAVRRHWLNWCRYRRRRHQEKPGDCFRSKMLRQKPGRDKTAPDWMENLEDRSPSPETAAVARISLERVLGEFETILSKFPDEDANDDLRGVMQELTNRRQTAEDQRSEACQRASVPVESCSAAQALGFTIMTKLDDGYTLTEIVNKLDVPGRVKNHLKNVLTRLQAEYEVTPTPRKKHVA